MNFYVLINYRKIRSKDKNKDNYLKIALKDVGTNGEKKYKSKIIVNDIKMDFSMNLIQKAMNYTKNHNKSTDIKVAIKPRTVKLEKKDKDKDKDKDKREKSFEKKKTGQMKSKMPILKKTVKAVTVINKIRSISSTTRPKKVNTIYKPPPKVQEKHEEPTKEDNLFGIKFPFFKKKSSIKDDTAKKDGKNEKNEKEGNKRLRCMHSSYVPDKHKTLAQMITAEKKPPRKLKTIKTEEIFLEPIKYDKYLSDQKNKKAKHRDTFCEGFFISSFPYKDGQVVEKSQSFPASCGHKECSSLPAMKPEIIY
jgi:hypothetical protein